MSIADKIRNIFKAKKYIKDTLIEYGSDINNDTILADYPKKISDLRAKEGIYSDEDLEFLQFYYEQKSRNQGFLNSTLDVIDMSSLNILPTIDTPDSEPVRVNLYKYFTNSTAEKIIFNKDWALWGDMESTFENCTNLKEIENLGSLTFKNINTLKRCFKGCTSLEYLDLSGWYTDWPHITIEDVEEMFADCISLKYLDLSNLDLSYFLNKEGNQEKVMKYNMFTNVRNLETLILKDTDSATVFYIVESLYRNGREEITPIDYPCKIYVNKNNWQGNIFDELMAEKQYPFEFIHIQ